MIFGILFSVLFLGLTIGGVALAAWGYSEDRNGILTTGVVGAILSALLFIAIPFSFHGVDAGEIAVVKEMGRIIDTREAGTHFDFWMVRSYDKYDTKVRSVTSTTMAYSKDKQTMDIEMTVQYQVDKAHVKDIALTYGSLAALESRINSVVIERTKSVLSGYNADSIISDRASVSVNVATTVEAAIGEQYFIDVTNIALTNIDFSDAYEASVEQSMIAKQEVERAKAEAEKLLVEAQNKIAIAQAEADAKKAAATGEAEAIKIAAEADAQALATIQAAWNAISPEVKEIMLREMAIEKWDGQLPDTMVGSDFLEQLLGLLNNN